MHEMRNLSHTVVMFWIMTEHSGFIYLFIYLEAFPYKIACNDATLHDIFDFG